MTPQENPTQIIEVKSKIDTREVRKVSFWISQIFMLAATVAGVYLAAGQGFKQAVAYEKLIGDKNNYYLRLSLKNELIDNISLVEEYINQLRTGGLPARKAPFQLDTFVWDSMKFSSSTLETPSELLTESRNFYRRVAEIHVKIVNNGYSADHACKLLQELIDHLENDVIPMFDADLERLKTLLHKNEINV